ncbi:MAG: hypothetical protein A3J79_05325 [Elusimicrobia bacterium RIFOXYB2_FULL_62_6]|nr:MAG: hypothetical protein A3J79_05325 [Elusimicrobia bacterium RIFOXYB2_FULL_62_6]
MDFLNDKTRLAIFGAIVLACVAGLLALLLLRLPPGAQGDRSLVVSSGTFSGTLDDVLKGCALTEAEKYGVAKAYSKKLNLKRLRETDDYAVFLSTWGSFRYMTISKDLTDYSVYRSSDGGFFLTERPIELKTETARLSGEIKSSLWESLSAAGAPADTILDFADIFSWSVDFLTEVRDGDKYALVYEYKTAPSGKVLARRVLAAAYDGAETGRKLAAYYNKNYYDGDGESVRSLFLRAPLHYRRISSYFTGRRFHPVLKYIRPHLGIDYAAPSGTPVSAVADGAVTFAGRKGPNGILVMLRHGAGYATSYGHLSRIRKGLRSGARVSQGDIVGYVGATGLATGPHLDFRIKQNGKFINFLKIKYRSSGGLGGGDKAAFKKLLAELLPEYSK